MIARDTMRVAKYVKRCNNVNVILIKRVAPGIIMDQLFYYYLFLNSSGVRMTRTSHFAERTIFSETLPIRKRSTALNPVAPQMIKICF